MTGTQMEMTPITREMEVRKPTTMALMQIALERGQVDQLQILQEMHFKELARSAEVEFNLAMNAVQSELGRIAPDLNNPQTKSKYASYAALDRVIRPIYTKHGFSLSFDSGDSSQPETVVAFCYVSHREGHTRKYQSPPMPADGKGAKGGDVMTKTHATGAAMSYGMRYLLKFIFNIAVGEDDTDGNDHASGGSLDRTELADRLQYMEKSTTLAELDERYRAAYKPASEAKDQDAKDQIIFTNNVMKMKIRKAGAK